MGLITVMRLFSGLYKLAEMSEYYAYVTCTAVCAKRNERVGTVCARRNERVGTVVLLVFPALQQLLQFLGLVGG